MKRISILLLLLGMVVTTTLAMPASKLKYEESRTVIKSFAVGASPNFTSDTKYSDLIITHSAVNEIQIKMVITTWSNSQKLAEKMLDLPIFQMNKTSNGASLSASFDSELSQQHHNWGNFNIKYYVSVPAATKFECTSQYGNVDMDRVENLSSLIIKYGNLNVRGLVSGDQIQIDMKYGNVRLKDATASVKIAIKYGDFITDKCKNVYIDSKYSGVRIEEVSQLKGIGKYDNYKIGVASVLSFEELGYTTLKIRELKQHLSLLYFKYSSLKIDDVKAGFSSIDIPEAAYSDIKLVIPNRSFKIQARTTYSIVKVYDLHKAESVSATIGSGNPSSTINISNKYGNIYIVE